MKRLLTIYCLLGTLLMSAVTSCSSARSGVAGGLHPDDVFTVTQDDIDRETWQINSMLKGEWKYKGPSVDMSGKSLLAGVGKPIAKGKVKKKLKKAFKSIGLDKACPQFTFNNDGTCAISLMGASLKGSYNYNPSQQKITFKWHGIPLSARLRFDGNKKMHLTFDADKLLSLIKLMGRFSDSSTIKALSFLVENYDDVLMGFELKR